MMCVCGCGLVCGCTNGKGCSISAALRENPERPENNSTDRVGFFFSHVSQSHVVGESLPIQTTFPVSLFTSYLLEQNCVIWQREIFNAANKIPHF